MSLSITDKSVDLILRRLQIATLHYASDKGDDYQRRLLRKALEAAYETGARDVQKKIADHGL